MREEATRKPRANEADTAISIAVHIFPNGQTTPAPHCIDMATAQIHGHAYVAIVVYVCAQMRAGNVRNRCIICEGVTRKASKHEQRFASGQLHGWVLNQ